MSHDPLRDPEPLIRRVYSYVAYRIGDGPDAEDVTSSALERALRYRSSYDPQKGKPLSWLIGIARACVDDHLRDRALRTAEAVETAGSYDLEGSAVLRMSLESAVAALAESDRELIALRYGADLSTRQMGVLLAMKPGAVDVALHRARERLRALLEANGVRAASSASPKSAKPVESVG
jgi:RNA polymerase sigma-70 factor (ECF subfamily)